MIVTNIVNIIKCSNLILITKIIKLRNTILMVDEIDMNYKAFSIFNINNRTVTAPM